MRSSRPIKIKFLLGFIINAEKNSLFIEDDVTDHHHHHHHHHHHLILK